MSASINTSAGNKNLDPYKAKSHEDPPLAQKIEDLVAFITKMKYGMLTTKMSTDADLLESRCMALAGKVCFSVMPVHIYTGRSSAVPCHANMDGKQEHSGIDLLFHTNLFSGKTLDLSIHPTETNMSFLDPVSGSWASISGTASIIGDPETVQKVYSPDLKVWLGDLGDGVHDGGPSDPRIGVIRLEAKLATYSVSKRGIFGEAIESLKGAAKGEVPDVASIRELTQGELAECECSFPSSGGLPCKLTDLIRASNPCKVDCWIKWFLFQVCHSSVPGNNSDLSMKTKDLR
jgi:general stress protein 26